MHMICPRRVLLVFRKKLSEMEWLIMDVEGGERDRVKLKKMEGENKKQIREKEFKCRR